MTGPRLRILHITAPAAVGGLERVVQTIAKGLHRRGHEVVVAAIVDRPGKDNQFLASLTQAGVQVHACHLHPRNYLGEILAVRSLLRRLRPHVVHTHGSRPDLLDAPLARRMGLPTATTVHGSSRMGGRTVFYEWLQQRSYRRFDAVVAVSRPLADELRRLRVRPERIHLIPNLWSEEATLLDRRDARSRLGLSTAGPVLGWVARLIRVKAADVFLAALGRITDLEWTAVIVGDGPERANLETLVDSLGIRDRVRFAGSVPQAGELFRAFDVFVISSRSEGTPVTLLEAVGAGVPVVSTSVGGIPELLEHGRGVLVAPESPEALAAGLREALADPAAAKDRARLARQSILPEDALEVFLDRHEAMYRQVIRRKVSDPPASPGSPE